MELIFTNPAWEDEGVLRDYAFDLAYGTDENDFELTLAGNQRCETGSLVYIDGTEYGGIVDGVRVVTRSNELTYFGRTWHGVLASKIIEPDSGEDYLIVSGEVNKVIRKLVTRAGLSELFTVSALDSGLTISNYQIERYVDTYTAIMKMLSKVSGKLNFTFRQGKVVLSACPVVDYSEDEQFDTSQVEMELEVKSAVNHLICLGKGELAERQVVHLYTDGQGNISETQLLFGLDEITAVYDYSNVESLEALIESGKQKLAEYAVTDIVRMDFDAEKFIYDIGDIVGAADVITDISAKEKIVKKIVTIKNGLVNIEYKVGE